MSNRSIGDEFEQKVSNLLNLPLTAKSGGHWDNADMATRKTLLECKYRSDESLTGALDHIKKLKKQAEKHMKEWIYVRGTPTESFVILSLDYFAELMSDGEISL